LSNKLVLDEKPPVVEVGGDPKLRMNSVDFQV